MTEAWVQRGPEEFRDAIAGELPTGTAWPRDIDSDLMQWVDGCAQIWGVVVEQRAADLLLRETDPRSTIEMLSDWERAFGLPDDCLAEPQTITDRQKALVNRITALGAQSRQFFLGVATMLGYTITITEFSPFMAGVSRAGDTRPLAPTDPNNAGYQWQVGPPEMRFYWRVHGIGRKTRWFRAGSGQVGVDPMVQIGLATDLECLLRRWKPAHTELVLDYSSANTQGVIYNWFRAGESQAGIDHMLDIVSIGGIADT